MKKKLKILIPALLLIMGAWALMSSPSDVALKARSVKLISPRGSCSGVQVSAPSGKDYILTAGHCRILEEGGSIEAITESGMHIQRRVIAEDPKSDLLLLEGVPGLKGLPMANNIFASEHVRTFTHGKGMDTYKTEGDLVQHKMIQVMAEDEKCDAPKYTKLAIEDPLFGISMSVCLMQVDEVVMTAMIVPGSSGGMVVDSSGAVCGIVSASDGSFGYIVHLRDIREFTAGY